MTTVATALAALRERLDETTSSQWADTEIRRWLNEGLRDIGRRTFHYTDLAVIPVLASTGEYPVAGGTLRILKVWFQPTGTTQWLPVQGRQLDAMDNLWYDRQDQTVGGYPVYFTTRGYSPSLIIKLYPIPGLAGTLRLGIVRMPVDLDVAGGTGNVDAPDPWIELAYDYAQYMAMLRDRQPEWKDIKGLYEEKIGDMINNGDYNAAPNEITWDGPYSYDRWLVEPGW